MRIGISKTACVSYATRHLGFSPQKLMSSQMSFETIRNQMNEDGFGGAF